jgi:photosystem II stability/assembly factor-like uncharacterized protein
MVTGRLGWVTAGLGIAAGSSGIAIFRTADGGIRWRLVELTPGQGSQTPGAIPFGCDKGNAAVFSDARTGWVAGSCAGGRPAFWVSRDGGRTWRHQPLPQRSGTGMLASCQCFLTAPVFTSPEDGALWATDMPGPPALAAAAYLTRDGGRTWTPVRLPGGRVPLQAPDFVDGQQGFVIAGRLATGMQPPGDVRLYATADGGATWASRSASPLLGQAALDFVTPAAGFATLISYGPLRSYLLRTSNGGRTWTGVPARLAGERLTGRCHNTAARSGLLNVSQTSAATAGRVSAGRVPHAERARSRGAPGAQNSLIGTPDLDNARIDRSAATERYGRS